MTMPLTCGKCPLASVFTSAEYAACSVKMPGFALVSTTQECNIPLDTFLEIRKDAQARVKRIDKAIAMREAEERAVR